MVSAGELFVSAVLQRVDAEQTTKQKLTGLFSKEREWKEEVVGGQEEKRNWAME